MNLAQRSLSSVAWNMLANLTAVGVGFVRAALLARLLPVETFGVYAFAGSVISVTAVIPLFGLGSAFIHRAPETRDEGQAAATQFSLQLVFSLAWAAVMLAGALIFTSGETLLALLVLTATTVGAHLSLTPRLILVRRVVHRRLALVQVIDNVMSSVTAVILAWQGAGLWALLSTDLVTLLVGFTAFYLWRPVWRPHLSWQRPIIRYFLRFGSRTFLATALYQALDRVDDLWTGMYLGDTALGYYSRAYTFATYPRRLLAMPVNAVAGGTYAELKENRKRLSQAFFRANAFLLRTGFLLAGLLSLIAPEFVRLVLGAKWLPMLDAFRLMLIYTLLDPVKVTVASVLVAVGKPEKVVRVRTAQLVVMLLGLFLLGPTWGIAGVALAVDTMLVAGIAVLLVQTRTYVDFSARRLFLAPGGGLIVGYLAAYLLGSLPEIPNSDWWTGSVKAVVFSAVYAAMLLILERRETIEMVLLLRRLFAGKAAGRQPDDETTDLSETEPEP